MIYIYIYICTYSGTRDTTFNETNPSPSPDEFLRPCSTVLFDPACRLFFFFFFREWGGDGILKNYDTKTYNCICNIKYYESHVKNGKVPRPARMTRTGPTYIYVQYDKLR